MHLEYEVGESWFDRSYKLVDGNEELDDIGENPTLDKLRGADRRYNDPLERLDLWDAGVLCTKCGNEINANTSFVANLKGELFCGNCADDVKSEERAGIVHNTDPTKAIISESSLHKKSLCDYVINVATGCRHGCKFCYVPSTPAIKNREDMLKEQADVDDGQREWGSYLLYRDDLPERLARKLVKMDSWKHTERGRGAVMLSSGTDCYQDRRAAQITRGCVQELVKQGRPVRILTRSPAVIRDLDVFKAAKGLVTVGSSIPSFDATLVKAMEPNAPPPSKRYETLDEIQRAGVPVFVSMSPTYPTMDENDFWNLLTHFRGLGAEIVFHEPINPRGVNFQMCYEAAKEAHDQELAKELKKMSQDKDYWVEYALEQIYLVQELADQIPGLQVHSWPDQQLIDETNGERKSELWEMKKEVSPEGFCGSRTPNRSSLEETVR